MNTLLVAFIAGALFGVGVLVSGMANPGYVAGFLDVAGAWDPRLAFVMAGAIAVAAPAFAIVKRRGTTSSGQPVSLPASRKIDGTLLGGAAIFGIGWGLASICPAPGLVVAGLGNGSGLLFVVAMLAGMVGYGLVKRKA